MAEMDPGTEDANEVAVNEGAANGVCGAVVCGVVLTVVIGVVLTVICGVVLTVDNGNVLTIVCGVVLIIVCGAVLTLTSTLPPFICIGRLLIFVLSFNAHNLAVGLKTRSETTCFGLNLFGFAFVEVTAFSV